MSYKNRWPDLLLPVGIIVCLLIIFMPLPAGVMDVLLAANISVSVVVLLSTIYIRTPLELSVFPSVLLATTLARLALNIGTTRLILTHGATEREMAAGGVIESFASFVTGDSLVVGLVIFSIIVVVQFVVITKGATRISEVAARFALDGLPGRQMAIDAELNAGTIDNRRAQELRQETIAHTDFYGAMDGASKFVRGDAIAGVVITLINIMGGLAIGISHHMSVGEAASTFTRLTIGDGLVSQLPALLISLAAGLLVTRSTQATDLPRESLTQVFARPIVLVMTAVFLSLLVITELPKLPLLLMVAGLLAVAYLLPESEDVSTEPDSPAAQPEPTEVTLEKLLSSEVMEMELGVGLIPLADASQGGRLLALVTGVRKQLASELGIVLPKIRIRDNLNLPPESFRILIQGNSVCDGSIRPDSFLATDHGTATGPIDNGAVNEMIREGMIPYPAFWIRPEAADSASATGYDIRRPDEVLADQLKQASAEHASMILTRDATRQLVEELQKSSPAVVDELIPSLMNIGQVQQVLKGLVSEGLSIRPLGLILETLGDHAATTKNRWDLVEKVRLRMGRHISSRFAGSDKTIRAFTISADLQDRIACAWERDKDEIRLELPREVVENLVRAIESAAGRMFAARLQPVAVVDQSIRPVIAELVREIQPAVAVLGTREIRGVEIEIFGEVSADQVRTAA